MFPTYDLEELLRTVNNDMEVFSTGDVWIPELVKMIDDEGEED